MDGGGSCLAELIWQRIIPGGVHMAEDHTWGSSYFELRKKIISGGAHILSSARRSYLAEVHMMEYHPWWSSQR